MHFQEQVTPSSAPENRFVGVGGELSVPTNAFSGTGEGVAYPRNGFSEVVRYPLLQIAFLAAKIRGGCGTRL